jgi:hypothetical protein
MIDERKRCPRRRAICRLRFAGTGRVSLVL